jgi:hypothetical protein
MQDTSNIPSFQHSILPAIKKKIKDFFRISEIEVETQITFLIEFLQGMDARANQIMEDLKWQDSHFRF